MIIINIIIIGIISTVFSWKLLWVSYWSFRVWYWHEETHTQMWTYRYTHTDKSSSSKRGSSLFPMWLKPSLLYCHQPAFVMCGAFVCICSSCSGFALNECQLVLVQAWAPTWSIDTSLGLDCLVSMQPWSCSLITPALRPWTVLQTTLHWGWPDPTKQWPPSLPHLLPLYIRHKDL